MNGYFIERDGCAILFMPHEPIAASELREAADEIDIREIKRNRRNTKVSYARKLGSSIEFQRKVRMFMEGEYYKLSPEQRAKIDELVTIIEEEPKQLTK